MQNANIFHHNIAYLFIVAEKLLIAYIMAGAILIYLVYKLFKHAVLPQMKSITRNQNHYQNFKTGLKTIMCVGVLITGFTLYDNINFSNRVIESSLFNKDFYTANYCLSFDKNKHGISDNSNSISDEDKVTFNSTIEAALNGYASEKLVYDTRNIVYSPLAVKQDQKT